MLIIHASRYRHGYRFDRITACHWIDDPIYPMLLAFSGFTCVAEFGAN